MCEHNDLTETQIYIHQNSKLVLVRKHMNMNKLTLKDFNKLKEPNCKQNLLQLK